MRILTIFLLINMSVGYNNPSKNVKLAKSNFKLVPYFAKPYIRIHYLNKYQKEELIQEGYIGLMMACRKYDEKYNFKFSTYSSYWIRSYMTLYIKKHHKNKNITSIENSPQLELLEKPQIEIYTDNLNDDEKKLLDERYFQRKTYKQLGEIYNVSRETLAKRCKKIITKLQIDN